MRSTLGRTHGRRPPLVPVLPREQIAPPMVAEDMIIGITRREFALESHRKSVVQSRSVGNPLPGNLESVREIIIRVSSRVLPAKRAVRMNEVRREVNRLLKRCAKLGVLRMQRQVLREKSASQRVIAWVPSFVSRDPPFLFLPFEHSREPLVLQCFPLICLKQFSCLVEAQDDECLMVGQPPALVV